MKIKQLYKSLATIVISLLPLSNIWAQGEHSNWTFMGKVEAVCNMERYQNNRDSEDYIKIDKEWGFLYSTFDGEKMAYKIYVPQKDEAFSVKKNIGYTGEKIEWSSDGKRLTKFPGPMHMHTHYAIDMKTMDGYYFNVTDVIKD